MPVAEILYKYLDVKGGLAMLKDHNLQFTNASKFNDPFDCHPALFDYSHAPVNKNNWPPADYLSMKGENEEAVLESCQQGFIGLMYPSVEEVKYKDILQKPDYFKDHILWIDLWTTKAKAWEHEQEVRLITKDPAWVRARMDIPKELKDKEIVDGKEIRHYPELSADCFESVYLGINIDKEKRQEIIAVARKCNPNIKIYQITTDPEAFRLKAEQI
jgi:hypothetical protein